MIYHLKYTNNYREVTYLANLGNIWPGDPSRRLIERVTTKTENARQFASVDEARETLVITGNRNSKLWQIVDETGKVVE